MTSFTVFGFLLDLYLRERSKYDRQLEIKIKERTRQLVEAQNALLRAERFSAIGELAGMVGHDLRNPLMSIRTATNFLKKRYNDVIGYEGKKMMEDIDKSIDYSDKIISDLLEYSREIKLEPSKSTPRLIVDTALALVEVPKRIMVTNNADEVSEIEVDAGKIIRVLVNLITNSIDAIPEKGVININSTKSEETTEIVIKDNGIGMSQETLSNLWKPLFTTKSKGMGFGVSICKRIIEAHNGEILVESEIAQGTEITLIFPNKLKPPSP